MNCFHLLLHLSIVTGNYRDLLQFAQRLRLGSKVYQVQHHEYYQLTFPPNAILNKVMKEQYTRYLEDNFPDIFSFIDHLTEATWGSLMPVNFTTTTTAETQRYEHRELKAFFTGGDMHRAYELCLTIERWTFDCINSLIDQRLRGLKRQHAKTALYYLELVKRISQCNHLPAFSSHCKYEETKGGDYLTNLHAQLSMDIGNMVSDRQTLLPEMAYVTSMLRYVEHQAAFLRRFDLTRKVFQQLANAHNIFPHFKHTYSRVEEIPFTQTVLVKNEIVHLQRIIGLAVPQRDRMKREVAQVFVKDETMYVSFPDYCEEAAVCKLMACAKNFLRDKGTISDNSTSLTISFNV